jgi:hypothetical protein
MAETDERESAAGGVAPGASGDAASAMGADVAGGSDAEAGADASGGADAGGDEAEELRAEDESAKAMEAEVPHSEGYDNPGQEPPAGS